MLKYILAILFSLTLYSANSQQNISAEKNIFFSGLKWQLRNTNSTQGPGPNYFSERSAWVDEKGSLHLY
ncbi:MAG TPA: hypothetical protein VHZ50_15495, partial [Puia sp.]|nr:hypothetical protein [Puia sp.]